MKDSTKQAFAIFEDWKNKQSALVITGPLNVPSGGGVTLGPPKRFGKIFGVDRSSEIVFFKLGNPGFLEQDLSFDFSGAECAVALDMSDPKVESFAVSARLKDGGMVVFVRDFPRDTGHTPLRS